MTRTRYKILPGDTQPYFVTATTVNWLPLFSNPEIANTIFTSLKFLQSTARMTIYAYDLMENHLYLVVAAEHLNDQIRKFKSYTARQAIDYYQSTNNIYILNQLAIHPQEASEDRQFHFWQPGVQPKRILDREMMRQKIEYIHHNPVKRGYVDEPQHWRYSSARNFTGLAAMMDVSLDW